MKKTIFTIKVDNVINIITNSSSELFVLKGETKNFIEEMIAEKYPEYRSEYGEVKNIKDLTVDELETYFSYNCSPHMWPARKENYPILPGFTFDELYEKDGEEKAWNGQQQYKLKRNEGWNFVTESNKEELINKLCPSKDMWFLFSLDENPNWEMQEELMQIAERYHLG